MMSAFLAYLQQAPLHGPGFTWDDFRTMLMTLITGGVVALLALTWKLRDSVRDLVNTVGSSDKKGTVIQRLDGLEGRVDKIDDRNLSIDLVMRQYVKDMRNLGKDGGGQRASDRTLQDAVVIAFGDPDE